MKKLLIAGLLLTAGLYSCQKKNNITDPTKVVIDITSPKAGQVYHKGDSVVISATVNYPSELHGYEVKITDTVTGLILYDVAQHVHNDHFDINYTWTGGLTTTTYLKMEVIAEVDHDGTSAEKQTSFLYQQ